MKNLSKIINDKDIITKGYLDNQISENNLGLLFQLNDRLKIRLGSEDGILCSSNFELSGGGSITQIIPTATSNTLGVVQLNSSTDSASTTMAATPAAVKTAYDLAYGKVSKSGDSMGGNIAFPFGYGLTFWGGTDIAGFRLTAPGENTAQFAGRNDGDLITLKGIQSPQDNTDAVNKEYAVTLANQVFTAAKDYSDSKINLSKTLVATAITAVSGIAATTLSPSQDTPRLVLGKTYSVYVDGEFSYAAKCIAGKLWDFEEELKYRVLQDSRDSSGMAKICESNSNNTLLAITNQGYPWRDINKPLEIYEVGQISEEHLQDVVTSVNGKKGAIVLGADDVNALSKGILPMITTEDDGKILGVLNGIWSLLPSGVSSVNGQTGAVSLPVSGFGTCETAAEDVTKVVDSVDAAFVVKDGAILHVRFTNANTAPAPKLSVGGSAAYVYDARTSTHPAVSALGAGTHQFVYYGGVWVLLDPVETPSPGGGTGGAKTQKLLDVTFSEPTAIVSVPLEHNFHRLFLVWHCGSSGAARTVDENGEAVNQPLCLMLDTSDTANNYRKIGMLDGNTNTWQESALLIEYTDDLSTLMRSNSFYIAAGITKSVYNKFGGNYAMLGTIGGPTALAPEAGRQIHIRPAAGFFAATTRIILVGEYYE